MGWGKAIRETLTRHNLPTQLDTIKNYSKGEWTRKVKTAIEKCHIERLIQDCHKIESGVNKRKTKTAHIVDYIKDPSYQRAPLKELLNCIKVETKTILLSRFAFCVMRKKTLKGPIVKSVISVTFMMMRGID